MSTFTYKEEPDIPFKNSGTFWETIPYCDGFDYMKSTGTPLSTIGGIWGDLCEVNWWPVTATSKHASFDTKNGAILFRNLRKWK